MRIWIKNWKKYKINNKIIFTGIISYKIRYQNGYLMKLKFMMRSNISILIMIKNKNKIKKYKVNLFNVTTKTFLNAFSVIISLKNKNFN